MDGWCALTSSSRGAMLAALGKVSPPTKKADRGGARIPAFIAGVVFSLGAPAVRRLCTLARAPSGRQLLGVARGGLRDLGADLSAGSVDAPPRIRMLQANDPRHSALNDLS